MTMTQKELRPATEGHPERRLTAVAASIYVRGCSCNRLRRAADQTANAHYQTFDIDGRRVRVFGNPGDSYFAGT